jgi:hypothetical protein
MIVADRQTIRFQKATGEAFLVFGLITGTIALWVAVGGYFGFKKSN